MSLNRFRRYEHVGGTFVANALKAMEEQQKAQAEVIRKAQEEAAKKAAEEAEKKCPTGNPGCNCKDDGTCNKVEDTDYTCEEGVCVEVKPSTDNSMWWWLIGGGVALIFIIIIIIIAIVVNRRS